MAESLNEEQPQLPVSRGYAVLITNKDFPLIESNNSAYPGRESNRDKTRKGAAVDDTNLHYIFNTKLKIKLLGNRTYMNVNQYPYETSAVDHPFWIHNTKPADKTKCPCISCKIQTTDHTQSECFVLAISTHGVKVDGEQEICFRDDLLADRVTLTNIIETLNDENCKTLKGIPRIILLQACRSDPDIPEDKQVDMGHTLKETVPEQSKELTLEGLEITDEDESKINRPEPEATDMAENDFHSEESNEIADVETIPGSGNDRKRKNSEDYFYGEEKALHNLPSDFLIVFPTVSGMGAWHNFTHGSWLIDELRKVVEKHDFKENPNMNFLSVLTSAAGRVARDKEGEKGQKTAVCIVHRLLRPIIFKDIEDTVIGQPNLLPDNPAL